MEYVTSVLDNIRTQIAADDDVLKEARDRLAHVLDLTLLATGASRKFSSGSLAHLTVNKPVSDADGGVVLDRTKSPKLGPDGDGVGPNELLKQLQEELGPKIRMHWPEARVYLTKRALKVQFNQPFPDGQDPTVDVIVALDRAHAPGLWIPNTEANRWDASHPEDHTRRFSLPDETVARVRRRAIRLAKAWNKQYSEPALCSFNIEAIGLDSVQAGMSVADALFEIFSHGAESLSRRLTPDPAGVSKPIKLPLDRDIVVARLRSAAALLGRARDGTDAEAAAALEELFGKYDARPLPTKAALATTLRDTSRAAAAVTVRELGSRPVKAARAYGGRRSAFRYAGSTRSPWYLREAARAAFARGRKKHHPRIHGAVRTENGRLALVYSGSVQVPYYESREIRISFGELGDPSLPRVTADGAAESKHRFSDGSLCMWYPDDPESLRWTFHDGLVTLIDMTVLHLFREAWWREKREWLGAEAPHRAA